MTNHKVQGFMFMTLKKQSRLDLKITWTCHVCPIKLTFQKHMS